MHHCIQLTLAGYDSDNMRGKLETFMNKTYERNMVRATILNTMANIAPGFGMIGTLVGLIVMLSELDSGAGNLGQGLALATLAESSRGTVGQHRERSQIIRFKNQLTADAFLLPLNRASSLEIQDHLNGYLDPAFYSL